MAFWRPGTVAPGSDQRKENSTTISQIANYATSTIDREVEKEGGVSAVYNPNQSLSLQQQRIRLPIYHHRLELMYLLETNRVVIVVGETGSGKTTQLPQYLHECGWTRGGRTICVTQPRRVAATSVAKRVAEEMGVRLGQEVGYAIRFDDKTDPSVTRIKFVTDGMLLRELMLDPLLSQYSVVMLDEAHERSLYTDLLAGLLKKIMRRRKDLRLIVSSATIDALDMKRYFDDPQIEPVSPNQKERVSIISIEGRLHPVDVLYSQQPTQDYLQGALNAVMDIHRFEAPGDILVFLTGQEEIESLVELLKEKMDLEANKNGGATSLKMKCLPLYAGLPWESQMAVFEKAPPRTRKVIISTNIAETSITIDGIAYVVDCGFVKIRAFNPKLGIEQLIVVPISQAAAKQRAGRAGRNRPGKCFRLYTEEAFEKLIPQQMPEMQRVNLSMVILQLKALGIDNLLHFDFICAPPIETVVRALEVSGF